MNQDKGSVFLMPCPVADKKISSLSREALDVLHGITHFIVERAKTARHFIKDAGHPVPLPELFIHEITDDNRANEAFLHSLLSGINIGVISEAGCPCIADPGSVLVLWAHKHGIRVVPLVGPSSILLALMASGMNGQNFAFNGYLSNKKPELSAQLKQLENKVNKSNQTQIWMETPYRNQFMIETCMLVLNNTTLLCIACDINCDTEDIQTQTVGEWKKTKTDHYHKRLCIYLMG
ncbi:MAG TPA: SAM-dependent methyltransferase [Saprospiraceae bacterium]|nr:SAM-dependent methyltransferase [Saprospiraceae bacterium]